MPPSAAPCHRQQPQDVVVSSSSSPPSSLSAPLVRERNKHNSLSAKTSGDGVYRVVNAIDESTLSAPVGDNHLQQQQHHGDLLSSNNINNNNNNISSSLYSPNSQMMMMYGGGLGGIGSGMGGYGNFSSPFMGGSMMTSPVWYGSGGGGPLSSLNQMLFGVQTLIMSLGQAVQIIGMNTQALHQVVQSMTSMFDHAVSTFYDLQQQQQQLQQQLAKSGQVESEEMKKKRRRIQALRWALVVGATYAAYRLLRRAFFGSPSASKQRNSYYLSQQASQPPSPYYASEPNAWSTMTTSPYYAYNPSGGMSSYPNSNSNGYYNGGGGGGIMPQQYGYGSSPSNMYGNQYGSQNPYF